MSDELTDEQIAFHNKLEMWSGPRNGKAAVLNCIEGVRIQGGYVCLELYDNDYEQVEYAISLSELVKIHGEFISGSDPETAARSKAEMLKSLRDAILEIESQHSDELESDPEDDIRPS